MSSIRLDQVNPAHGDEVTFTVEYPKQIKNMLIGVDVKQGDEYVLQAAAPARYNPKFWLESVRWQDGPAEAVARLYYFTYHGNKQTGIVTEATTKFSIAERQSIPDA